MLGRSYTLRGISKGTKVANLFMAGNMWSSFQAIDTALSFCGAIQFPMGGLIEIEQFMYLMKTFEINVVFGLPGLLADMASKTAGLKIDTIFYAGETPSKSMLNLFKEKWSCHQIYSAGYASVDIGPIGYQDASCKQSEHILFNDLVELEVINGEGVITSKVRTEMPVIRYKTGDQIEIIEKKLNFTKFKLLGRADKKLNIWSSRVQQQEVIHALRECDIDDEFQVVISDIDAQDKLTIHTQCLVDKERFAKALMQASSDLYSTHELNYVMDHIDFDNQNLEKNQRTGKTSKFVDLREY